MPFVVSVDGEDYNTDDLTLDEAIAIERETGRSWATINPFASGGDCKAIIATFLSRTVGAEEAAKRAGAMSLKQVLASVRVEESDLPDEYVNGIPKAGGEPATTGSSGAPADSPGRQK